MQVRTRQIETAAAGGGTACPDVQETLSCDGLPACPTPAPINTTFVPTDQMRASEERDGEEAAEPSDGAELSDAPTSIEPTMAPSRQSTHAHSVCTHAHSVSTHAHSVPMHLCTHAHTARRRAMRRHSCRRCTSRRHRPACHRRLHATAAQTTAAGMARAISRRGDAGAALAGQKPTAKLSSSRAAACHRTHRS